MLGVIVLVSLMRCSLGQGDAVTRALSAVAEYNSRLGGDLRKGDRAIDSGGVKDFSDVVLGMIESLQDIEDKGDEMVQKIDVQEEHLDTVQREIEAKETYVSAINQKIKINEAKHSEMVEALRIMEEDKIQKEEQTRINRRKIKAQEVRLQRLLKDITTKVNYVQVIDVKVKEMETMTRSAAKGMLEVKERRDGLGSQVKRLERSKLELERQVKNYTALLEGRRQMKMDESRQFEMEVKLYNQTIEQMEGALEAYRGKISAANSTLRLVLYYHNLSSIPFLSSLELAVREKSPPTPPAQESSSLWPALLISLAGGPSLFHPIPGNFAMGGLLMGGVEVPPLLASGEEPEYDYAEGE